MSTRLAAERVKLKRAYEESAADDGMRVLVDRLWPRGVSKDDAAVEKWLKDLAPSTELRKWFNHDPARWAEFQLRYGRELAKQPETIKQLRNLARKQRVTLVYSAHDEKLNNAVVLRRLVLGRKPTG